MRLFLIIFLLLGCNIAPKKMDGDLAIKDDPGENSEFSGFLEVPENRQLKNGKTIRLAYTVLKATGDNPKKDPIVYLQGGPGGPTLVMANFWKNNDLRKDRDIVLMDQRGTGLSNAICADLGANLIEILAMDLSPEGEYLEMKKILQNCHKEAKSKKMDLSAYNSRENAADFESLRELLGYDQWNIYGGSYGSRLGLTIMRDFPNSVRSATLFGIFAPETDLYSHLVSNFKQALFGTFKECKSSPDCDKRYPNLNEEFAKVLTKLKNAPYVLDYNGRPWVMNTQDFLLVLHQMLYKKNTIGEIPSFIVAIGSGNDQIVRKSLQPTLAVANFINFAMYMSVNANDELPFNGDRALLNDLEKNPEIPVVPAFFGSDPKLLQEWHPYRSESFENEKVISSIPTLILNGSLDPITPPANAKTAALSLSNSFYVSFENEGHSFFGSCFFELSKVFLDNPDKRPKTDCLGSISGIDWE